MMKEHHMAMYVHLTFAKNVDAIRRGGISRLRSAHKCNVSGVFALPVVRNFYISHQWLRELKRRGRGSIVGVYFRIPDNEHVWIGHYNSEHRPMTATQAAAVIMSSESAEGWQVLVPRRID